MAEASWEWGVARRCIRSVFSKLKNPSLRPVWPQESEDSECVFSLIRQLKILCSPDLGVEPRESQHEEGTAWTYELGSSFRIYTRLPSAASWVMALLSPWSWKMDGWKCSCVRAGVMSLSLHSFNTFSLTLKNATGAVCHIRPEIP